MNSKVGVMVTIVFVALSCIILSFLWAWTTRSRENFKYGLGKKEDQYPLPIVIKGFLTPEEIKWVLEESRRQGFKASEVLQGKVQDKIRVSQTCWLSPKTIDFLPTIYERFLNLPMIVAERESLLLEDLQVVEYSVGGFYRHHYDQCHEASDFCREENKRFGGPRKWTLLISLNDDYDGGSTEFPELDKTFQNRESGDAILFRSLTEDNHYVHPLSLHAGTPVLQGKKYIANIWARHLSQDEDQ